ncbi:MAG TPA: DUF6264 family protein [Naasia sp.]
MSDDRPTSGPAPRWGEYAPAPPPAQPSEPVAQEPVRSVAPPRAAVRSTAASGAATRPWDRVLTIALLVLGVINVLTSIPQMLTLSRTLDDAYRLQGIGDYTNESLATAIGIAINVVGVILLLAAAALALSRLRAGRLAFWVPLVAGATAFVITAVLMLVAMLGDPALSAYLGGQAPGA